MVKVKDHMERMATKENKMREQVSKMLPVKLHLKAWEDKV